MRAASNFLASNLLVIDQTINRRETRGHSLQAPKGQRICEIVELKSVCCRLVRWDLRESHTRLPVEEGDGDAWS